MRSPAERQLVERVAFALWKAHDRGMPWTRGVKSLKGEPDGPLFRRLARLAIRLVREGTSYEQWQWGAAVPHGQEKGDT